MAAKLSELRTAIQKTSRRKIADEILHPDPHRRGERIIAGEGESKGEQGGETDQQKRTGEKGGQQQPELQVGGASAG
jgi:hypothetical protein